METSEIGNRQKYINPVNLLTGESRERWIAEYGGEE